ncbi:protein of unassigned function [Methylobacterium oryzae CBMB20]|uniref:Protein of unassigned function n=1 Tax=Methylobacterium oryzae CBMB20 TaxID=693986 RepID=A0A089NVY2_9HYPH|nr:protein of unassigned function [Methylobacterium oryzae CBMB20]
MSFRHRDAVIAKAHGDVRYTMTLCILTETAGPGLSFHCHAERRGWRAERR